MAEFISIKEYLTKKSQEYRLYIPFKAVKPGGEYIEDVLACQYDELADKDTKVFGGMTPMLAIGCFGFDSFDKARFAADFCDAKAIITLIIKKKTKGLSTDETFWTPYVSDVDDNFLERAKANQEDVSYYKMKRINWCKSDLEKLDAKFEMTLVNIDKESIRMEYGECDNGKVMKLGQFDENFIEAIASAYPTRHIVSRRLNAAMALSNNKEE